MFTWPAATHRPLPGADPHSRGDGAGLELGHARLEPGELAALLGDELALEHQGEELARRDAVAGEARREQQPAMNLPAIPAGPGHEAGENR